MKHLVSALGLVAALGACEGPTGPQFFRSVVSDSLLPESLRALYRDDAARLALRELQGRPGGYDEIAIPDDLARMYYDALVLVHNATGLPARDTVVDVYRIHTFPWPTTRSLLLQVAGSQEWAQRLARGELPTGDAEVDRLLSDYALSLDRAYTLSSGELLIVLRPAVALNIAALASLFGGIPGVRFSEPNGPVGDGNDIRGSRGETILLDYSVGYGDCPSGCIGRRAYRFAVHADGMVEYRGASGDPPPSSP